MLPTNGIYNNWLVRCAVGVFAAAFLARSLILFTSRYYNVAAEANALYAILEFHDGGALYPMRGTSPYYVNLYPPVHALFAKALLWLSGANSLHTHVLIIRSLSLVGLVTAAFLMARRFLPEFGLQRGLGILVLALSGSKFADYAGVARNDLVALGLDAGTVFFLLRYLKAPGRSFSLFAAFVLALFSVWTRQTGVLIFGAFLLVLVTQKKLKPALSLGVVFATANVLIFITLNAIYPAFNEQVILANLRSWRPVDRYFFDASLLSFLASYLLVVPLALWGAKVWWKSAANRDAGKLFAFCAGLTLFHATLLFLRAGGDVNYFLPSLFFALPFIALGLSKLFEQQKARTLVTAVLALHLAGTATICALKARSAFATANLPFAEAAAQVRALAGTGFLDGFYSQGLGINLRGWGIQGPDVTNGGKVASNSHPSHAKAWDELRQAAEHGGLRTAVLASPGCATLENPFENAGLKAGRARALYSWLCVYELERETLRVSVATEQAQ